jgi:hypothetical protein
VFCCLCAVEESRERAGRFVGRRTSRRPRSRRHTRCRWCGTKRESRVAWSEWGPGLPEPGRHASSGRPAAARVPVGRLGGPHHVSRSWVGELADRRPVRPGRRLPVDDSTYEARRRQPAHGAGNQPPAVRSRRPGQPARVSGRRGRSRFCSWRWLQSVGWTTQRLGRCSRS